jgi:hypothetical protein
VYQESEIVDLLMVVFLTPIMVANVRAIHIPGKRWFVGGYLIVALGHVFTVLEGFIAPEAFNVAEHVSHAVMGALFFSGALSMFRSARAPVSEQP